MIFATKAYRDFVERVLNDQREGFTARLTEKDTLIRQQRIKIASLESDNERMRLVLMPLGSPAGAMYAAKFNAEPKTPVAPVSSDWQSELNKLLQEEEDGIRSAGRVQEHQPSADDGSQAQHGA